MEEKIDWYKVSVLSWAKKNQHICWKDHVKAETLAMARETAKLIRRKEKQAARRATRLAERQEIMKMAQAAAEAPEVEDKAQEKAGGFMPHAEARRVPSFMLRRKR